MQPDIKKAQQRLLEIALNIRDILEKHQIPYSIMFGTLLGAERHQGFIPWDDDFDFILFDDSYDHAISVLRKEFPSDIFIEDDKTEEKFFHSWARAKCKKSVTSCDLYPFDKIYKNKGLIVDLYRAKKLKISELSAYKTQEQEIYFKKIKALNLIDNNEYEIRMQKSQKSNNYSEKEECIYGFPFAKIDKIYVKDMHPLKKILFEGEYFYGPNDPKEILNLHYGNYLKIPEKEYQKNHYSSITFL